MIHEPSLIGIKHTHRVRTEISWAISRTFQDFLIDFQDLRTFLVTWSISRTFPGLPGLCTHPAFKIYFKIILDLFLPYPSHSRHLRLPRLNRASSFCQRYSTCASLCLLYGKKNKKKYRYLIDYFYSSKINGR